jgi:hypothetical protein
MQRLYPKAPCWNTRQDTPCPALLQCRKCQELFPVIDFYKQSGSNARKDKLDQGRNGFCKRCANQKYIKMDPITKLIYAAKRRAVLKDIEFSLEPGDIKIPERCPVLGIPLFSNVGQGRIGGANSWNAPTLDRVDNSKGYVKGNVCVISRKANTLKGNGTPQELAAVALYASKALLGEYRGELLDKPFIETQTTHPV